ncbi:hypothetical protein B9G69_010100 [Bdellovibrio sp. SKB1291214]|uniref:hypothetical protein n=1 Tax=Bdellovibrio sp. SKB1291214 TaxID=1732569 RepID=UPI0011327D4B|nr:hypothetical protein [Bdellovibrio sp. SKB1291214]UYL07396.1 hypothetical protein B9G69_010100 [Bdellovibrio sp. SKB1291214]
MKNINLFLCIFVLMGCTKEDLFPSTSLEGGTWITGCSYSGTSSIYGINTARFAGGSFYQSATAYGAGCTSGIAKMEITGTYSIGSKLATSGSVELDLKVATLTLTPLNSTLVSNYNNLTYCGYSDWAIGVAKDVAGRTCDGSTQAAVGEMIYDIYNINQYSIPEFNIVQGNLSFGYNHSSHDGKTPAKRPEATNGNFSYSRN